MGTVLMEISWAPSGGAVVKSSADKRRARGTVIGHLARDKMKAFTEEYPQGRSGRHTVLRGPRPHLRGVAATRILWYSKPGLDRELLATDDRTIASGPAPEHPSQQAPGARPGRDAHSDGRDPFLVPPRAAVAQRHGCPGAPQRELGGGPPGGRVAGRASVRSAGGRGFVRAVGEPLQDPARDGGWPGVGPAARLPQLRAGALHGVRSPAGGGRTGTHGSNEHRPDQRDADSGGAAERAPYGRCLRGRPLLGRRGEQGRGRAGGAGARGGRAIPWRPRGQGQPALGG